MTFIIDERNGGRNAGYISSGFAGGKLEYLAYYCVHFLSSIPRYNSRKTMSDVANPDGE